MFAIGDTDKRVTVVAVEGLEEIAEMRFDGDVRSLSFSPCGTMLVGGGGNDNHHGLMTNKSQELHQMKTIVWKVAMEGENCAYLGTCSFTDIVHAVAFSPSGMWLAVGCENRAIS